MIDTDKVIDMVLDAFYLSRQKKVYPVIEFVDDLYKRRLELAYNDEDRDNVTKNKEFISGRYSTIVFPRTIDGAQWILISKEKTIKTLSYINSIAHELTYCDNYRDFAAEFCNGDYNAIEQHNLFSTFFYWTEFWAKRNGYFYYREILYQITNYNPSREDQIKYILGEELISNYDSLVRDLTKYKYDKALYVGSIMQFLGRFSAWQDSFSEITVQKYLPPTFQKAYGSKIFELYETLRLMPNFNIAKGKLKQLGSLVNSFLNN